MLSKTLAELNKLDGEALAQQRYARFRALGAFDS